MNTKRLPMHLLFLPVIFFLMVSCGRTTSIELYVSPSGNDTLSGSLSSPLANIPEAVRRIRVQRKSGNYSPATVYLREGIYNLVTTLVLGPEDGLPSHLYARRPFGKYGRGSDALTGYLTFSAYRDEHPVVQSCTSVKGWQLLDSESEGLSSVARGKVWVADIPLGIESFNTLYDSEGRLQRSRSTGFVPTERADRRTLHFPRGVLKNWDNLGDIEVQIRPTNCYVVNMLPLESVDEFGCLARTSVSATYPIGKLADWVYKPDNCSAWVENTLEGIDEPGEWCLNTLKRKVYLWPSHPGADGSPVNIQCPVTSELVRVEGNIDYDGPKDTPVVGISFKGITFTRGDRMGWKDESLRLGWGMQHDWDLFDRPTSMLRFRGVEFCSVDDCCFLHSGGTGIRFDLHAQGNRVSGCEFSHLGEAGIILAGYGCGQKDVNHHNDIVHNHLHHFGEITWHAPGIWAWQSGHNLISGNQVHHSNYSAILVTNRILPHRRPLDAEGGRTLRRDEISPDILVMKNGEVYDNWKQVEKYYHARENLVEYNDIHHSMQLLSDGNCIYVSGAGRQNVIRYNYIHDNTSKCVHSQIRCDDIQHETQIYGNVMYNNYGSLGAIVSKGLNTIENNLIVSPCNVPQSAYIDYVKKYAEGSRIHRNIIVSHPDGGVIQAGRPMGGCPKSEIEKMDVDYNIYYNPSDPHWADRYLQRMQKSGREIHSIVADPMFIDPSNGNFGFKSGSPAIEMGIEDIDLSGKTVSE